MDTGLFIPFPEQLSWCPYRWLIELGWAHDPRPASLQAGQVLWGALSLRDLSPGARWLQWAMVPELRSSGCEWWEQRRTQAHSWIMGEAACWQEDQGRDAKYPRLPKDFGAQYPSSLLCTISVRTSHRARSIWMPLHPHPWGWDKVFLLLLLSCPFSPHILSHMLFLASLDWNPTGFLILGFLILKALWSRCCVLGPVPGVKREQKGSKGPGLALGKSLLWAQVRPMGSTGLGDSSRQPLAHLGCGVFVEGAWCSQRMPLGIG